MNNLTLAPVIALQTSNDERECPECSFNEFTDIYPGGEHHLKCDCCQTIIEYKENEL